MSLLLLFGGVGGGPPPEPAASLSYAGIITADAPFVVLVELQPAEKLNTWTNGGGGLSNTYSTPWPHYDMTSVVPGGIFRRIDRVQQNATVLVQRASNTDVEANFGSWFYDYNTNLLWVSTTTGGPPDTVDLMGVWFTIFASTTAVSFDDRPPYWPIIVGDLPTLTSEMPDALFGATRSDSGNLTLLNGEGIFDRLAAKYIWRNKLATFRLGGIGMPYADFGIVGTLRINSVQAGDDVAQILLEDGGSLLNQTVPYRTWGDGIWTSAAVTEEGARGLYQPIVFGLVEDCPLVLGSKTGFGVWYSHDADNSSGTNYVSVTAVEKSTGARTTLVGGGVHFIESSNFLTIVDSTYTYEDYDIIATLQNTSVTPKFGSIAKRILQNLGVALADIDVTSFAEADVDSPTLARYISEPRLGADYIRELEQSVSGQVYRSVNGMWHCRMVTPDLPDDAVVFANTDAEFVRWDPVDRLTTVLHKAIVRWGHKPFGDDWREVIATNDAVFYGQETADTFRLEQTWLTTEADAATLAYHLQFWRSEIGHDLDFEERGLTLMQSNVGDVVQVWRSRAQVARTGAYQGHVLRIVRLEKELGTPLVRGTLLDLDGQTDRAARCLDAAVDLDWDNATEEQRALYGFCTDAEGYLDDADPTTHGLKVAY